jgi:uncharacterized tellurite resistance protein B-like protein
MPVKSIRAWLGLDRPESPEPAPLRDVLNALDHIEPARARYLAAFAYLLGRVAYADRQVSPEETRAMERALADHGQLAEEQAMLVTQLAKTSNVLFGGTADFLIAREFAEMATDEQKRALMRCVFAVSATDQAISLSEESEIHRLARELRLDHQELIALRVEHQQFLPGRSKPGG